MKQEDRRIFDDRLSVTDAAISRRAALGTSLAVLLGLLSGSAPGGELGGEAEDRAGDGAMPERMRRRVAESRAFAERMRDAGPEGRLQIIQERIAAQRQQTLDDLKEQLGISDTEWRVIKPRLDTVYDLVHPMSQGGRGNTPSRSELQQKTQELRELLNDKGADVNQIKARLTAVRAAKEKANQKLAAAQHSLRQLMTIRQEATLVLNGLLD